MSRSTFRRRIFVDTSAYYAATDEYDQQHELAALTLRQLVADRYEFVTSNFVLAELHALIIARIGRSVAYDTLVDLLASERVIDVTEHEHLRAMEILRQYADKSFTLTDAYSFAVMERFEILSAFTFDRHFEQFGWRVVPSLVSR